MRREAVIFIVALAWALPVWFCRSQDKELDQYRQLDSLLTRLKAKDVNDAYQVMSELASFTPVCPGLEGPVKKYRTQRSQLDARIDDAVARRNQLDLRVQVIHIDGIVESVEKGYSIINAKGSLIAVKTSAEIGNPYRGDVRRSAGEISYKPLGGSTQLLPTYSPVSGGLPQEQYSSLTREIETLKGRYQDLWVTFKMESERADSAQLGKLKQSLLDRHYTKGETLLAKQDFDSALDEFTIVKSLDPGYRDIDKRLDEASNKNHTVAQSDVYQIVSPKPDDVLIGTSRGIFESLDRGRTWKLKALPGKKVNHMDALGEKIVIYDENQDIILFSATGGKTWSQSNVQYNVSTKQGTRYSFFQPNLPVESLRLIPYGSGSLSLMFLRYAKKEGWYHHADQNLHVQRMSLGGFGVYSADGKGYTDIPVKSLSPDGGAHWVGFWKVLWSNSFYGDFAPRDTIMKWIDCSLDFSEDPENATSNVVNWLAEKKSVGRDDVKVAAFSTILKAKKGGSEQVLVATNFGVYRTCWECEKVEEVLYSAGNNKILAVYLDNDNPNLIMLGLEGQGVVVSEDGGLTWKGV